MSQTRLHGAWLGGGSCYPSESLPAVALVGYVLNAELTELVIGDDEQSASKLTKPCAVDANGTPASARLPARDELSAGHVNSCELVAMEEDVVIDHGGCGASTRMRGGIRDCPDRLSIRAVDEVITALVADADTDESGHGLGNPADEAGIGT